MLSGFSQEDPHAVRIFGELPTNPPLACPAFGRLWEKDQDTFVWVFDPAFPFKVVSIILLFIYIPNFIFVKLKFPCLFIKFCYYQTFIQDVHPQEAPMLKRYQVLLPDWLEEYIKFLVDQYDASFSEALRVELCIAVLCMVPRLFPEYKAGIDSEEIAKCVDQNFEKEIDQDERHRYLSKIYFEARKAIEFRLKKEIK